MQLAVHASSSPLPACSPRDGCCTSADVGADEVKGSGGWWDWHPSKTALEFLWRSGELTVTRREGFRKVYDLTERVIPDAILRQTPETQESIHWLEFNCASLEQGTYCPGETE